MVLLCLHRHMCVLQMFLDYLILARTGSKIMVNDTDTSSVHLFNHIWLFATHGLQHARFLSPSSCPGACSKSCLLIWWCHPTISPSVIPFSFCLQYFPASGSFPVTQYFASDGQSTGASASASVSVLSMNIQDWFLLGLTGLISLLSRGVSRIFSKYSSKASVLQSSPFFMVQLSHPYMTTGKTIALTIQTFVCKIVFLLLKTLSRFVIAFFQGASVFECHDSSHHMQWFWSPRK